MVEADVHSGFCARRAASRGPRAALHLPARLAALFGLHAVLLLTPALVLAGCAPGQAPFAMAARGDAVPAQEGYSDRALQDIRLAIALGTALVEENVLPARVAPVVFQRRVLLLGNAASEAERQRIVAVAHRQDGVVQVIDELRVRSNGSSIDGYATDSEREREIRSRFLESNRIDWADYRVRSIDGTIYLIGSAADAAERDFVVNLARGVVGDANVVSYIRIDRNVRG